MNDVHHVEPARPPASSRRTRRAFTLIEVVVALTLGIIVIGAAILILDQVEIANRRQHLISEMQRDGAFANQLLQQELRLAGLGVPSGHFIMDSCDVTFTTCTGKYGTNNGAAIAQQTFNAKRLIVARGTTGDTAFDIGMVGDVPRPDANYNLFGPLHSRTLGVTTAVVWHTENNGSCVETTCPANQNSMWFSGAHCIAGSDPGASPPALTCAWSSRRLALGEHMQIVDGDGNWSVASAGTAATALAAASFTNNGQTVVALPLAQTFDASDVGGAATPRWANTAASDGPGGILGQGWVTSLDRVFFHLDTTNKRLTRTQCWGDPDPTNANWPIDGNNQLPASFIYTPASTGFTTAAIVCTAPEVVARNVSSLVFSYVDGTGTVITPTAATTAATLNNIKRVSWLMKLVINDAQVGKVEYDIEGATALQN